MRYDCQNWRVPTQSAGTPEYLRTAPPTDSRRLGRLERYTRATALIALAACTISWLTYWVLKSLKPVLGTAYGPECQCIVNVMGPDGPWIRFFFLLGWITLAVTVVTGIVAIRQRDKRQADDSTN